MGKLLVALVSVALATCAIDRTNPAYAPYQDLGALSSQGGDGGGGGM